MSKYSHLGYIVKRAQMGYSPFMFTTINPEQAVKDYTMMTTMMTNELAKVRSGNPSTGWSIARELPLVGTVPLMLESADAIAHKEPAKALWLAGRSALAISPKSAFGAAKRLTRYVPRLPTRALRSVASSWAKSPHLAAMGAEYWHRFAKGLKGSYDASLNARRRQLYGIPDGANMVKTQSDKSNRFSGLLKIASTLTLSDLVNKIKSDGSMSDSDRKALIQQLEQSLGNPAKQTHLSTLVGGFSGGILGYLIARYFGAGTVTSIMAAAAGAALGTRLGKPKPQDGYDKHKRIW